MNQFHGMEDVFCRKADINLIKRAGELTEDEVECAITIMHNPLQYKIPDWFLEEHEEWDIQPGPGQWAGQQAS